MSACRDCNGEGTVIRESCVVDGIAYFRAVVDCFMCNGAGEMCDVCGEASDVCDGLCSEPNGDCDE